MKSNPLLGTRDSKSRVEFPLTQIPSNLRLRITLPFCVWILWGYSLEWMRREVRVHFRRGGGEWLEEDKEGVRRRNQFFSLHTFLIMLFFYLWKAFHFILKRACNGQLIIWLSIIAQSPHIFLILVRNSKYSVTYPPPLFLSWPTFFLYQISLAHLRSNSMRVIGSQLEYVHSSLVALLDISDNLSSGLC